jgi:hypothetical protein
MMQHKYSEQQSKVGNLINSKSTQRVSNRTLPLIKECDQKDGSKSHQLPTSDKKVDRSSAECKSHTECKEKEEQEETQKALVSVKVSAGERTDESGEACGEPQQR